VVEDPIPESLHRSRIGLVLIRAYDDGIPGSNDATQQLFDLSLGGSGIGSPVPLFQNRPFLEL
jgi:hypothetical protein